jgi:hypothetical protein
MSSIRSIFQKKDVPLQKFHNNNLAEIRTPKIFVFSSTYNTILYINFHDIQNSNIGH